jgi:hypothetical protein
MTVGMVVRRAGEAVGLHLVILLLWGGRMLVLVWSQIENGVISWPTVGSKDPKEKEACR